MDQKVYSLHNFKTIPQISNLTKEQIFDIEVVGNVFPFKTNSYVVGELINWDNFENDPLYILNFPQKEMLSPEQFNKIACLLKKGAEKNEIKAAVNKIRLALNPNPAGQVEHNVPEFEGEKLHGIQHKYNETVLFFPSQGQTCHAYCTFCFRWPQFSGMDELKFATKEVELLIRYVKANPEITDILITGGDPMVMSHKILSSYIDAIIEAEIPNLKTIRIGSKTLSFWPHRYLTDKDSDQIISLFKRITNSGLHLSFMAHINHYNELKTSAVKQAIKRIKSTGAQIRTQSPLLKNINANSKVWATMWQKQIELGLIPYYMFIARNTGTQSYFAVNLEDSWNIYKDAYKNVSGISRTVRGPSMSAGPGKIQILGISEIRGKKYFVLNFIQGRAQDWVQQPFFAEYNPEAIWLDDLKPAFGEDEFFYEEEYKKLLSNKKLNDYEEIEIAS